MMTIGRNDLCTCGSGKKYKKCCGKLAVVSIDQVVESELHEIQSEIFQFSVDMYTDVIEGYLEQYSDTFDNLPDDAVDLFDFFARVWVVTSVKLEGKTILEEYVDMFSRKYKRPRTRDVLQSWKQARPSAYIVTNVDKEGSYITVQDIFTRDEQRVKIFEVDTEVKNGYFVFGTLLPAGANSIFFTTFLELPAEVAQEMEETILELYEESDEKDPVEFMTKEYIEVFTTFMFGKPGLRVEDFAWQTQKQLEVAVLFQKRMLDFGFDETVVGVGLSLWSLYCERKNPGIKKTNVYEAALVYLVEQIYPFGGSSTQKELATEYGVSATSISTKFRELDFVLEDEIKHFIELVNDYAFENYLEDILAEEE